MIANETIGIYRNRRTGEYRIQPYGRLPQGSSQPFGEQSHVSSGASDEELLRAILDNLAKNDQTYLEALSPKITDAEWHRQLKEDQLVDLEHLRSGYRLIPSRRQGNGFGSIDEMIYVVPSEEFLSRGGEIIRKLFDRIP